MFHFSKTSLLVNNYHLSPYLLGQWEGKSVFWGDMLPWDSPLNTKTSIAMGPTVTNVALDTVVEMGFSQIILAGVDLCYSRDGHTHAKSSREHALGSCFVNTDVQVETYGGWLAYTTPAYAAAIGVLDYQAQRALTRGCQIVNPAPGAARMPHVRHLKLEELVIDSVQGSPTEKIFQSLPADTKEERSRHYRQVISEIDRAVKSLSQIRDLSTAALSANKKLFGRGLEIDGKQSHRLEKVEKKLSGKHAEFSRLLKGFGVRHFIKVVHPDTDRFQRRDELESFGEVYYQAYRDSSDHLVSMLAEARCRLEGRLQEENDISDVRHLAQLWREDGQPGRVLVWKERRLGSANTVNLENEEIIEDLTTEFEGLLKKGYMNYTAHSEIQEDSYAFFLSGALSRMVASYKKKALPELENAVKIFASHPSPKAKSLTFLTQGYLAELSQRYDDALDRYQDALDTEDKALQEEALRSIAFLCLKIEATEDALLALRHLSETSPIYLPMYSETLKALGRVEEALEVYAAYLEQVPEDYTAMLNLGCYYRDLGMPEGARLMFTHVLEAVPEHRVARMLLEEMG
jgi:tetratricopeptide (TPR) repeat protein